MTCRQDGKRWSARLTWTLPDGGRRWKRVSAPTRAECLDRLAKARLETGETPAFDERLTVRQFADHWLTVRAAGGAVRASTVDSQRRCLARLLPPVGDRRIARLSVGDVQRAVAADIAAGRAASTVAQDVTVLKAMLNDAVRWGVVARSPARDVSPPRVQRRPVAAWSPDDATRFAAAAEQDEQGALWVVAVGCGLRRGELLGLQWRDLDLDAGVLRVERQAGQRRTVGPPKTDASRRPVWLSARVVAALRRQRARQAAWRLRAGEAWQDGGWVFTNELGRSLNTWEFAESYERLCALAGVPRLTPHACRHTYATNALRAGVHPRIVQESLGHTKVSTTLDTYSHPDAEAHRDAAERIDQMMRLRDKS